MNHFDCLTETEEKERDTAHGYKMIRFSEKKSPKPKLCTTDCPLVYAAGHIKYV